MQQEILGFLEKYPSLIITTHSPADADGLATELVFAQILREMGKTAYLINATPVPQLFSFMDTEKKIETWDEEKHGKLCENSALLIVDTSDEYNIGNMREILGRVREVFVFDHHEKSPFSTLTGVIDSKASSASEMAVETACEMGITLDNDTATAAFAGISFDTGSFAYAKTTGRTFKAALALIAAGVVPYKIYRELNESASLGALLLRRLVLNSLELYANGRVAVLCLRKEDLTSTGAQFEDAESFINMPLRAREVTVSLLIKENEEGNIRCSLRSKGEVNVSKIAQVFGGGGHITAAGFKSKLGFEDTKKQVLEKVLPLLDAE
ncbi:MAG: bifunctional oligoribonuclease/PAP phosphatase NrnA [Treponema sp.]|nr:bifunctional oligoribonuclease/PAP phosphatase NrnA [Treponema sp.]